MRPLVVICTKDRPDELRRCLAALKDEPADVHLVDASAAPLSEDAWAALAPKGHRLTVTRTPPQLTAQRNVGIDFALSHGYDVVFFLDDDVVIEPGYVAAVLESYRTHPEVAGVGAVVTNEPPARTVLFKRLFALWSLRPGAVLPSGRNVIGHYDTGRWPQQVDWLSGCSMSYRLDRIGELRFDERLIGPGWSEDVDFGFRMSRQHTLIVDGRARLAHYQSPVGRARAGRLARSRVSILHAWVTEHHEDGLRRSAFWWSILGEVILSLIQTPFRPSRAAVSWGLMQGTWDVLRHGSDRSRWVR